MPEIRSSFLSGEFVDRLLNLGNRAHFKIIAGFFGQGISCVAELVFWAIVGGQEVTKEASQPPVRAKVGATLVPGRSQNQLL